MTSRHRLRGRGRFAEVRSSGFRASSAGIRAQLARNGLDVGRVGFALVGMRSAVRRNRLRRRLREAVRPLLAGLAGHDLVIVAGSDAAQLDATALADAVNVSTGRALQRAEGRGTASRADNGAMGSAAVTAR